MTQLFMSGNLSFKYLTEGQNGICLFSVAYVYVYICVCIS